MRRLFWLGLGIAIGVAVMRRLGRIADRMTPNGILDSLGGALGELVRDVGDFAGDVRASMSQRERQLREGTGLDTPTDSPSTNGRVQR